MSAPRARAINYESAARHDANGQPYVAYYRNDLTTGFIWSGHVADDVQVTREMGEPIIDTFPIDIAGWQTSFVTGTAGPLAEFARQCDAWIESGQAMCEWFALCDHEATGTLPHPVLGDVPICDRCRARATDD